MMDYQALRTLIETNVDHATLTDGELATWVNDPGTVTRNRASMPIDEMVQVALSFPADYAALSVDKRDALLLVSSSHGAFDLTNGTPVREALEVIFAGTSILTELATRLTEDVSRAENAGITGRIRAGDIEVARTA